jgi:hypothetical protein
LQNLTSCNWAITKWSKIKRPFPGYKN